MKILYWFLVVFCSILTLIFILFFFFGEGMENHFMVNIIFLFLTIGGLIYGIRKIREKKIEAKQMQTTEYTGNLNLNLSGQISYKDYRNSVLEQTWKKYWYLSLFLLLLLTIGFDITSILIVLGVILLTMLFIPILTAKKIYKQNKMFHEKWTYHLDNEKITFTSETTNSTTGWNRLFKITETQTFFLLWHDSMVANFLDKKMFTEEEIIEFRKFVNSLPIKKELKK